MWSYMDKYLSIIEAYQNRIIDYIKPYIAGKRVLDVGCGNGLNAYLFAKKYNADVFLMDIVDMRHSLAKNLGFMVVSILLFLKK